MSFAARQSSSLSVRGTTLTTLSSICWQGNARQWTLTNSQPLIKLAIYPDHRKHRLDTLPRFQDFERDLVWLGNLPHLRRLWIVTFTYSVPLVRFAALTLAELLLWAVIRGTDIHHAHRRWTVIILNDLWLWCCVVVKQPKVDDLCNSQHYVWLLFFVNLCSVAWWYSWCCCSHLMWVCFGGVLCIFDVR
jgi:hypothetical protein